MRVADVEINEEREREETVGDRKRKGEGRKGKISSQKTLWIKSNRITVDRERTNDSQIHTVILLGI